MSHTKGRLRLDPPKKGSQWRTLSQEFACINGLSAWFVVARVDIPSEAEIEMTDGAISHDSADEVARRFEALWNAAEELGLTTEAIEAGAIQNLAEGCRVGLSRAQEMRDATDDAVADTGIWGLGNEALADDIDIIDCALAQCRSLTTPKESDR